MTSVNVRNALQHLPYQLRVDQQRIHALRMRVLLALAKKYLAEIPAPVILDVGCGRGEFMREIAQIVGASVYRIDPDAECVRISSEIGPVYQGTVEEVLASNRDRLIEQFDLVVSSHSLEHMRCPYDAVIAMKEMTRRYLLFAVPNPHFLPRLVRVAFLGKLPPVNDGHLYAWDAPHFHHFLTYHCGLNILEWSGDWVKLVPGRLRGFIDKIQPVPFLEARFLPQFLPRLAESLIVMCEKPSDGAL